MRPQDIWSVLTLLSLAFTSCVAVDNGDLTADPLLLDGDQDGFSPEDGDCDDSDPARSPSQAETCNQSDDDCDGEIDDGFDVDGDEFTSCGDSEKSPDCDDLDDAVYPGAEEVCDGVDNNCSGENDEGFDQDKDGIVSCSVDGEPADCNDESVEQSPENPELCDGIDNDCDKKVDEGFDDDGDGWVVCEVDDLAPDCDDNDKNVNPDEDEVCNGIDDNCDDDVDEGFDDDEDGVPSCQVGNEAADCRDNDANIYPGAKETCDGKDNNCNAIVDEGFDDDEDDYYQCKSGSTPQDCDDDEATIHPGASETCNGIDDDCDGQKDEGLAIDDDNDTFASCAFGGQADCDDQDASVNPAAPELCDGIDQDCDDDIDEDFDADRDGYPSCALGGDPADCDDGDPDLNPGVIEDCDDIDNNCDGEIDELFDQDGDGYTSCGSLGKPLDCNDFVASAHPDGVESCNAVDDDCDGEMDEGFDVDGDGFNSCGSNGKEADCEDENVNAYPHNPSEPCDGIDNDCSGGGGDLYVATDKGDFATIQSAIDGAGEACVVVVAAGTWGEHIDFKGHALTLRSEEGPTKTIIDGSAVAGTVVRFMTGEGPNTVLEGFYITGGTGENSAQYGNAPAGGGMVIGNGSGPTIRGNIIIGNRAQLGGGILISSAGPVLFEDNIIKENWAKRFLSTNGLGGAVFLDRSQAAVFVNNSWEGNHADQGYGAMYIYTTPATIQGDSFTLNYADDVTDFGLGGALGIETGSDVLIEDSNFVGNTSYGDAGAVYVYNATAVIRRTLFADNESQQNPDGGGSYGGALRGNPGTVTVEQCVFTGNVNNVASGGAIYAEGTWIIRNNLFYRNEAVSGGAIFGDRLASPSVVVNNTFVDNKATSSGGSLSLLATNCSIYNNILAYTLSKQAVYYSASGVPYSTSVLQYNDFYQNPGGNYGGDMTNPVGVSGNVAVDPQFVDYVGGDFTLKPTSPLLDAGNPGAQYNDLDTTRNEVGMFGGPLGDWDIDAVMANGQQTAARVSLP